MNGLAVDQVTLVLETTAWIVTAVLLTWFGFGLLACGAARLWPRRRAAQRAVRWSPALVRRFAGVACTTSFVLAPQMASAAERVADEPVVRAPQAWVPATEAPPPPSPAPTPPPTSTREYVVRPGDNLWLIAQATVGGARSDGDVARYWSEMIDANRATLRSGDPSLIFPGEIITLPSV